MSMSEQSIRGQKSHWKVAPPQTPTTVPNTPLMGSPMATPRVQSRADSTVPNTPLLSSPTATPRVQAYRQLSGFSTPTAFHMTPGGGGGYKGKFYVPGLSTPTSAMGDSLRQEDSSRFMGFSTPRTPIMTPRMTLGAPVRAVASGRTISVPMHSMASTPSTPLAGHSSVGVARPPTIVWPAGAVAPSAMGPRYSIGPSPTPTGPSPLPVRQFAVQPPASLAAQPPQQQQTQTQAQPQQQQAQQIAADASPTSAGSARRFGIATAGRSSSRGRRASRSPSMPRKHLRDLITLDDDPNETVTVWSGSKAEQTRKSMGLVVIPKEVGNSFVASLRQDKPEDAGKWAEVGSPRSLHYQECSPESSPRSPRKGAGRRSSSLGERAPSLEVGGAHFMEVGEGAKMLAEEDFRNSSWEQARATFGDNITQECQKMSAAAMDQRVVLETRVFNLASGKRVAYFMERPRSSSLQPPERVRGRGHNTMEERPRSSSLQPPERVRGLGQHIREAKTATGGLIVSLAGAGAPRSRSSAPAAVSRRVSESHDVCASPTSSAASPAMKETLFPGRG